MKRIKYVSIVVLALLTMVSCKKYDDTDVWNAINELKEQQENANKEGITPVVKTVNEEMYISYDNGTTWTKMANGMYSQISYDEQYVTFTLTDGTELKVLNANYVVPVEKGAIKAAFSVAEGKQVYFSQGNLQYKASTNVWRFAPNQWETIGEANANIAEDYDGWIDLFGWGTSGWAESGAVCYQPWSTSTTNSDYYVGGSYTNNLTGAYANADWGVYNKIANGGNEAGLWRTLTKDEWVYLTDIRNNAREKLAIANVNGINGLIILPDLWICPNGLTFTSGFSVNQIDDFSIVNNYSLWQWIKMEEQGAIFLPTTGLRVNTDEGVIDIETGGRYWSSTIDTEIRSYSIYFQYGYIHNNSQRPRANGFAVRLVQDVK